MLVSNVRSGLQAAAAMIRSSRVKSVSICFNSFRSFSVPVRAQRFVRAAYDEFRAQTHVVLKPSAGCPLYKG